MNNVILKITMLLTAVITLSSLNAQTKKQKTQHQRDSSVVIIFTQKNSADYHQKAEKESLDSLSAKNIIKIAPLGFVGGTYPLIYERKLFDGVSMLGGIGLTGRNFGRTVFYNISDVGQQDFTETSNGYTKDIADKLYSYDHRVANIGNMYFVQLRKYIMDYEGMDGRFVGLTYDNRQYNYTHQGITAYNNSKLTYGGPDKKETEYMKSFYLVFGDQHIYKKFSVELSTEIGVDIFNGTKYCVYNDYNNNNGSYTLTEKFVDYNLTTFHINVGFKLGYHF